MRPLIFFESKRRQYDNILGYLAMHLENMFLLHGCGQYLYTCAVLDLDNPALLKDEFNTIGNSRPPGLEQECTTNCPYLMRG